MPNNVQDIIFGWFSMPERLWDPNITRIRWISLKDYDIRECTDIILEAVRDQTIAKNIAICCFQRWAGTMEKGKIRKYFDEIVAEVQRQEKNKVCFSTALFLPNSSPIWPQVAQFNDETRWYNELLKMPPMSLHKMGTTTISEYDKTLRVRGMCFSEFQSGLGFGTHPSYEGCQKIKSYMLVAFDNTFAPRAYTGKSRFVRVKIPPPLIETEGYRFNAFHRQELELRGLAGRPAASEGARSHNLTWSHRRPEGWQRWDMYLRFPMNTKEEREHAHGEWLQEINRTDPKPVWGRVDEIEQVEEEVIFVEEVIVAAVPGAQEREVDLITFSDEEAAQQEPEHQANDDDLQDLAEDFNRADVREDLTVEIENTNCNEIELELSDYEDDDSFGIDRYNQINEQLVTEYRKELANKNVLISQQKTAARQWKGLANKSEEEKQVLSKDKDYYMRRVQVLEKQLERVTLQYNYLKGLYEQGSRKRSVKVNDRRFARKRDFSVNRK